MWFISLDTETSGLNSDVHEVIELKATALTRDFQVLGTFYRKLKMLQPELADKKALEINHYSEDAWATASRPQEVYTSFALWLNEMQSKVPYLDEYRSKSPIPFGQNPGFDIDMVTKNAARSNVGIKFSHHRFDVTTLSMFMDILRSKIEPNFVWQKSYSLEQITKAYGVNRGISHTAEADESTHLALFQFYVDKLLQGLQPRSLPISTSPFQRVCSWFRRSKKND